MVPRERWYKVLCPARSMRIAARGEPEPAVHRDHDEAFYLLSGELEIADEGKSFTAGSGDFMFCPRGRE